MWTLGASGNYIGKLKQEVQNSGCLQGDENGSNAKNQATSFGSIVLIFTSGLVDFTFLEIISSVSYKRALRVLLFYSLIPLSFQLSCHIGEMLKSASVYKKSLIRNSLL
jgi:hypothetical protein